MLENLNKIPSTSNPELFLSVSTGHYSSDYSHANYYIDTTTLKTKMSQAKLVAKVISQNYIHPIQLVNGRFRGFFTD